MKQILIACLLPLGIWSQGMKEQVVKSEIKQVKLFLTSAEMLHQQKITLHKGRNKIIFPGISAFADPRSIQFSGDGNFRLVSVSTEMDFLAAEQFNPRISYLNDSLEKMNDQFQANLDLKSAYQAELEVLKANKELVGKNQNITVAQIKEAAEFYRVRTLEIAKQNSKIQKEQTKLQGRIEKVRFQLVEMNYQENQRSNQVIVLIDCDEALQAQTKLVYLVSECGWAATYDLNANDIHQKVNLKYKARLYNQTGNDWSQVKLILSTADPKLSASAPDMHPWYLNYASTRMKKGYYAPQLVQENYREEAWNNVNTANQRAYDSYYLEDGKTLAEKKMEGLNVQNANKLTQTMTKNTNGRSFQQIEISELNTEFEISHLFSCPSDGKTYQVEVKELNLDAHFSHIAVPKLDQGAFLMAHITGWQELELMPGPTNVYFGGAYVGVSQIDTRNLSDTLSLSFGRDSKVVVMRKLKKELSSKKVMGGSKKESYLYEIAVRNNRTTPIKITVYDQVPITQHSDISISIDELMNGIKNDETGEVAWTYTLEAGASKNTDIGFTIKYPKDAQVRVQTYRTVSCPSF